MFSGFSGVENSCFSFLFIYLCVFFLCFTYGDFLFTFIYFFLLLLGSSFDLITFHTALTHTHTFLLHLFSHHFSSLPFFVLRGFFSFFSLFCLLIFRCVLLFGEKLLLFALNFHYFSLHFLLFSFFFWNQIFHFILLRMNLI